MKTKKMVELEKENKLLKELLQEGLELLEVACKRSVKDAKRD